MKQKFSGSLKTLGGVQTMGLNSVYAKKLMHRYLTVTHNSNFCYTHEE